MSSGSASGSRTPPSSATEPFTFTLLDSDVVNAFALPGGYVYVTRGLVALANNEAELAGVLGHEVGHVTARHSAQRYDQAQLGQVGALAAQLGGMLLGGYLGGAQGAQLGGQYLGQAGSLGAQAWVQGYSREQEFEADQLGIRYLGAAGYDPAAMASFLATLQADDAYRQRTQDGGDGRGELPRRLVPQPSAHARARGPRGRGHQLPRCRVPEATDRDALLDAIDGMIWGEDPAQGVVRGRSFQHPDLRIAFEAPPGFRLQNSPDPGCRRRRPGPADAVRHGRGRRRRPARLPAAGLGHQPAAAGPAGGPAARGPGRGRLRPGRGRRPAGAGACSR